jgi:IclR family KDG regulon transcriptional repressor
MPSVSKIHRILELLRIHHRTGLTNREISKTLNIPPSTCYRILADLKKYDYVTQKKSDLRYTLGFAHMRFAESIRESMDVVTLSAPYLELLHNETDETTFVALFNRSYCVIMEVYGNTNTRIAVGRGEVLPLYASAAGKAVLAFLPERERRAIIDKITLNQYTENTIIDPADLEKNLDEIRREGISYNSQEFHNAINALATPVFGHGDRVIGAIALVGFSIDLDREQMREFGAQFLEASKDLSRKMGGHFPHGVDLSREYMHVAEGTVSRRRDSRKDAI